MVKRVFTYSSSLQVVHKSFEGSLVTVTDDVIYTMMQPYLKLK
jgi:hypothetical protein